MWKRWGCESIPEWSPKENRKNGGKGCCAEEELVDTAEWEHKVEKVEKQECWVEVARKG